MGTNRRDFRRVASRLLGLPDDHGRGSDRELALAALGVLATRAPHGGALEDRLVALVCETGEERASRAHEPDHLAADLATVTHERASVDARRELTTPTQPSMFRAPTSQELVTADHNSRCEIVLAAARPIIGNLLCAGKTPMTEDTFETIRCLLIKALREPGDEIWQARGALVWVGTSPYLKPQGKIKIRALGVEVVP
jgi:hypothetical protein